MLKESLKNENLLKIVLIFSGMAIISDVIIYPAADAIYTVFSQENPVLVNYIITGSSLMVILGSILCGLLTRYIGKKTILLVSYIVFILSGVAAPWSQNLIYMIIMRTITGLTMGFVSISSAGLIAELFVNEEKRSWMMGAYTGGMSLAGAIMSYVSGILAVKNWHLIFYVYLIAVPVLIMSLIVVPKTQPEGKATEEHIDLPSQMYWKSSLSLADAAFVFNALYAVILTLISVYLTELQIGDAATAGTMGMLGTLGSMVASFAFSALYMKTKRATPVFFSIVLGIGFLILAYFHNIYAIGFAVTIMGGMYGIAYSYYLMYASIIVPPSKASFSISLANAAVYAGIFSAPYVNSLVQKVFKYNTIAEGMPVLAVICGCYAVLSICILLFKKRIAL